MSTPIQQLPATPHVATKVEEDPAITDVIQEMEKEFKHSAGVPTHMPPMQPAHVPASYIHPSGQHMVTQLTPPSAKTGLTKYINYTLVKTAVICAVVAFLVYYPQDLTHLYEKVPLLTRFITYDRIIRMLLLAVLLYAVLWQCE